jgi:hypothetical protein
VTVASSTALFTGAASALITALKAASSHDSA